MNKLTGMAINADVTIKREMITGNEKEIRFGA
jgi:hypothetical protein